MVSARMEAAEKIRRSGCYYQLFFRERLKYI